MLRRVMMVKLATLRVVRPLVVMGQHHHRMVVRRLAASEEGPIRVIQVDDDFDMEAALREAEGVSTKRPKKNDMASRLNEAAEAAKSGRVSGGSLFEKNSEPLPEYYVDVKSDVCPGCGVKFQSNDPTRTGYVPEDVLTRISLSDAEREVELLLADARAAKVSSSAEASEEDDEDGMSVADAKALLDEEERQIICQRCHSLRHGTTTTNILRASLNATEEGLHAENFEKLLKEVVKDARGVVILFVDLFDADGSLKGWTQIGELVGSQRKFKRRVLIAANKFDLLPIDVPRQRVLDWVRRCVNHYVPSLEINQDDVFLISAKTGMGVARLLDDAKKHALNLKGDVYCVGAANAGKSTLLNRALGAWKGSSNKKKKKQKNAAPDKNKGVTASNAPGTTLGVVKLASDSSGVSLYDTPGLLTGDSLPAYLTEKELKAVLPSKPLQPTCLRIEPGQSVWLGGFVKVELLESQYGAMFLTFCLSKDVTLHPTKQDFEPSKHVGALLSPPFDPARFKQLQSDCIVRDFSISGQGFEIAAVDLVLAGLGWISVTGSGTCVLRVTLPKHQLAVLREPLLPFEANFARSKFTGGRLIRPQNIAKKRAASLRKNKHLRRNQ